MGERVIRQVLDQANIDAGDIDQIAFTTITGIAAPSIDARLMNRIPFSRMKRMPLFGLGCMGGASGIARMADYLVGHPEEAALLLSVELCSLTIQQNDLSPENMVSTGLFGDGAAAVLLVGAQHPRAKEGQPQMVASRSVFFPETEYIMGWDMCGKRQVLSGGAGRLILVFVTREASFLNHVLCIHHAPILAGGQDIYRPTLKIFQTIFEGRFRHES